MTFKLPSILGPLTVWLILSAGLPPARADDPRTRPTADAVGVDGPSGRNIGPGDAALMEKIKEAEAGSDA